MITKFDINQQVLFLYQNRINADNITQITIRKQEIRYTLANGWTFNEEEIFDSLENILSYLRNNAQISQDNVKRT